MKKIAITTTFFVALFSSFSIFAQDIIGTWIQIDDKTGSPKALIEIQKQTDGSYAGKNYQSNATPRLYSPRNMFPMSTPLYQSANTRVRNF